MKIIYYLISSIYSWNRLQKNTDDITSTPIKLEAIKSLTSQSIKLEEIKNHTLNLSQAEKIAVLHSVFPESLKSAPKKSGKSQLSSITITAQKQNPQKTIKTTFSIKEDQAKPSAFVINNNEGGFIIISGDDRMVPMLAYSDEGNFEITEIAKLPLGVHHWLSANHRYIGDIRNGKITIDTKTS